MSEEGEETFQAMVKAGGGWGLPRSIEPISERHLKSGNPELEGPVSIEGALENQPTRSNPFQSDDCIPEENFLS